MRAGHVCHICISRAHNVAHTDRAASIFVTSRAICTPLLLFIHVMQQFAIIILNCIFHSLSRASHVQTRFMCVCEPVIFVPYVPIFHRHRHCAHTMRPPPITRFHFIIIKKIFVLNTIRVFTRFEGVNNKTTTTNFNLVNSWSIQYCFCWLLFVCSSLHL